MKPILYSSLAIATGAVAFGFSLTGPSASWQDARRGYDQPRGVMNINEEYRYNVPVLYYGFDDTFLTYFGQKGVQEIEKAIAILNALPPMSQVNLNDFPLDTRRLNPRAQALNLLDLKSIALNRLLENIGLASPIRYVFTLREVVDLPCCNSYLVIRRNFDPESFRPTSFVNGRLWTYRDIFCICTPVQVAWPLNEPVDPLDYNEPVVSTFSAPAAISRFGVGQFYHGLTRDDVGGLRYIYQRGNLNTETNAIGVVGTSGLPWGIPGGTNSFITNAVRFGVDKVTFVRANFDSLIGELFQPITNRWVEQVITNGIVREQSVSRVIGVPDLLFVAADTTTANTITTVQTIINNVTTEYTIQFTGTGGGATIGFDLFTAPIRKPVVFGPIPDGPGINSYPNMFVFNSVGPLALNLNGFFIAETNAIPVFNWGSFDGSTNITVYPEGFTVQEIEQQVIGSRNLGSEEAWNIPPIRFPGLGTGGGGAGTFP
ncbi:MAG: hypothetical protein AB1813_02705 [Verrucomicrobiota bacterium]